MFCSKCGKKIKKQALQCQKCGNKIKLVGGNFFEAERFEEEFERLSQSGAIKDMAVPQRGGSAKRWMIVGGIALGVMAIIVAAVLLLWSGEDTVEETGAEIEQGLVENVIGEDGEQVNESVVSGEVDDGNESDEVSDNQQTVAQPDPQTETSDQPVESDERDDKKEEKEVKKEESYTDKKSETDSDDDGTEGEALDDNDSGSEIKDDSSQNENDNQSTDAEDEKSKSKNSAETVPSHPSENRNPDRDENKHGMNPVLKSDTTVQF